MVVMISSFFLSGCGMDRMVTVNELNWLPSNLNSRECPNLSGDYIFNITRYPRGGHASNLIFFYAGSLYSLWQTSDINPATGAPQTPLNYIKDIPAFQSYYVNNDFLKRKEEKLEEKSNNSAHGILHLEQTTSALVRGRSDEDRIVTRLGTAMAGCSEGALILRHLENNGGNDFVPRSVSYGEFEMRKDANGSLVITHRRRERAVSFASGALGAQKEHPPLTRIYPSARP